MKKFVAALTAIVFAVGLALVGVAAPAMAGGTSSYDGTVDCTNINVSGNPPVTNGWQVNLNVSGTSGSQISAYVDLNVAGGYNGLGVRLTVNGTQHNIPLTQAQVTSGKFSINYSQYLTGAWTITWSQFGSDDNNLSLKCGTTPPTQTPKVASASIVDNPATCQSAETVTAGTLSNATWQTHLTVNGSSYTAVAVATSNAKFSGGTGVLSQNNTVETFTGHLDKKLSTGCGPPPTCIAASNVSYTYNPATNGGIITVHRPSNSTGELCEGFYVTATSWKYTVNNSIWPQVLDQVNDYYIHKAGHFPYSATVHCGQGDIYAAYGAQPTPPGTLTSPGHESANVLWDEHFLHDMGFTGINPTYTQQDSNCLVAAPSNGTPSFTTAQCHSSDGNTIDLPPVDGGIWTVTEGSHTKTFDEGTGTGGPVSIAGFFSTGNTYYGTYTVTLADANPNDAYQVPNPPVSKTYVPFNLTGVDCNTKVTPTPATATAVTTCGTWGEITIPADTTEVHYFLNGNAVNGTHTTTVQADGHNVVTAVAQDGYEFADGSYPTGGWPFELGTHVDCIHVTPADPSHTNQVCTSGVATDGTITVDDQTGLVYTITGGPSNIDLSPATGTTTGLLPGSYTVSVAALDGYILDGPSTFPIIVIQPATDCRTITATATASPAECVSTDNNTTPPALQSATITVGVDPDVIYSIDGTPVTAVDGITQVGAGTHTVTAELTPEALANGESLTPLTPEQSSITIDPIDCTISTPLVVTPNSSTCSSLTNDGTPLTSWINIVTVDGVDYTIAPAAGGASEPISGGYTAEPAGDYIVTATAEPGWTLDLDGDTTQTTTSWPVTVEDTLFCQLPTGATWNAGATGSAAVCTSQSTQAGTITLTHLASQTNPDRVHYTITKNSSGKVVYSGSHATKVKEAPGKYTVVATAVDPADGLAGSTSADGSITYNVSISAAAAICSTLTTLAFTGGTATLGLLLAGAMLFLGAAGLLMRRRFGRSAE